MNSDPFGGFRDVHLSFLFNKVLLDLLPWDPLIGSIAHGRLDTPISSNNLRLIILPGEPNTTNTILQLAAGLTFPCKSTGVHPLSTSFHLFVLSGVSPIHSKKGTSTFPGSGQVKSRFSSHPIKHARFAGPMLQKYVPVP